MKCILQALRRRLSFDGTISALRLTRFVPVLLLLLVASGLTSIVRADVANEGLQIVSRHSAIFSAPPQHVPVNTMPDGPLLGNGDLGVVLGGPAHDHLFYFGKNDFWRTQSPKVVSVGSLRLTILLLQ